jgi:hypothetical protein
MQTPKSERGMETIPRRQTEKSVRKGRNYFGASSFFFFFSFFLGSSFLVSSVAVVAAKLTIEKAPRTMSARIFFMIVVSLRIFWPLEGKPDETIMPPFPFCGDPENRLIPDTS